METKNQPPKKEHDRLAGLKYKGYCRALTAPGEGTTFDDLVNFAKFYLCRSSHRLWKDPIWDEYTDEEILIEYFGHFFKNDETARKAFEVQMDAGTDVYGEDIFDWLDRKVLENQKEFKEKVDEMPEKISFSPTEDIEE